MAVQAVRIEGHADLRRDLRKLERSEESREVTKALKEGARLVARGARPLSARKSGKLAASWQPGSSGNTAFVRSRVPYAGVLEYGGTIAPRGTRFTVKAKPAATRALESKEQQIIDAVGDAMMALADRHGW